jgi:hypothetical protein
VTLQDAVLGKSGLLELPIDVRCEDEVAVRQAFAPAAEDGESVVRHRGAIQVHPVPEEAPRQLRVGPEPVWVTHLGELPAAERRVRLPEPGVAAEVGQAGIDAHARTGPDKQGVGGADGLRRMLDRRIHVPLPLIRP